MPNYIDAKVSDGLKSNNCIYLANRWSLKRKRNLMQIFLAGDVQI